MYKVTIIDKISFLFCILGCLILGLVGLFNFNVAIFLTGGSIFLQRIIYTLVFLGCIDIIILLFRCGFLVTEK
ncbi:DUF378 domain-containing protein [Clostridium vincentii]|uniref:DUF378 domain-containing protein n=1 Tax=Clostridium vincentii TaxID=52704 RepID=A0A2T0BF84_9CLOT|nr:DUF378 domain-containing protein [Clostridium vincentii]PRR82566.1 hypothetical protein CLVI_17010 [Clostridium vincentii]